MAEIDFDSCFQVAADLAKIAGERVCSALNTTKDFKAKKFATDLVTETDQEVEKFLFNGLKEKFPDHKFIGEESTAEDGQQIELTDAPTWIIDPIDGTMNFVHGFPFVAVSIALVVDKKIEIAVIYAVGEKKLYTARKGQGAYCESEQIRVSNVDDLSQALVLADPCGGVWNNKNMENFTKRSHGVRTMGSAVIGGCFVASGFGEAFYHYRLQCWDVAAISLLVTEAGGVVIDPSGSRFDLMSHRILCANSETVALQISNLLIDIPYNIK